MRPFHEQLTNARPRLITQEAAASLAGVSRRTIVRWESGDGCPSASQLARLIAGYGVTEATALELMRAAGGVA
jgi:DNA-binding XRE family transcriptional regulator